MFVMFVSNVCVGLTPLLLLLVLLMMMKMNGFKCLCALYVLVYWLLHVLAKVGLKT